VAGTRPTLPTRWADVSAINRVAVDPGLRDVGFPSGSIVPSGENNERQYEVGEWLGYLSDLSPATDDLDFRRWLCPDDPTLLIEWRPAPQDGALRITTGLGVQITTAIGTPLVIGGAGTLGLAITSGGCSYDFIYDTTTDAITAGAPPLLRQIIVPAACTQLPAVDLTYGGATSSGSLVLTSAVAGNVAIGSLVIPHHAGALAETVGTDTGCFLRSATLWVTTHNQSGVGNPDTIVSIESMDATGTWTQRATATLTTPIAVGTAVTIPGLTTLLGRLIPRGAPLRLRVEHAAISGQTQFIEIASITLDFLRTAAD
jgi:hypothetical protein